MNDKIAIVLSVIFIALVLAHYLLPSIAVAIAIYLAYVPRIVASRKSKPRHAMEILSGNFLEHYNSNANATRSLEMMATGTDAEAMQISKTSRPARLGASNIIPKSAKNVGAEFNQFIALVANGITKGSDVKADVEIFRARVLESKDREKTIREKTEGMYAISQMGISFFFPMFAGISSNIMQNAIGLSLMGPTISTFTISIIAYIGLILFISFSFRNPKSSLSQKLNAIIPLFVTGVLIFLLSSYISNIF